MPRRRLVRGDQLTQTQILKYRKRLEVDRQLLLEFEALKEKPKPDWSDEDHMRYSALRKRCWRMQKRRDAEYGKPVPKSYSGTPSKDRPPRQKSPEHYKKREVRKAAAHILDNIGILERCAKQLQSAAQRCERNGYDHDAEFMWEASAVLRERAERIREACGLPPDRVADLQEQVDVKVYGKDMKRRRFLELSGEELPPLTCQEDADLGDAH